jgi:hypothetical protein
MMTIRHKDQIRTVIGRHGKSYEQVLYAGIGTITIASRDLDELRSMVSAIEKAAVS